MITLLIFYLHTIAAVILFTRRWQEADWKEGLVAVGFLLLIFGVGWSMSTFILKLFVPEKGFGPLLDRDAMSLLLLAVMETILYYAQFRRRWARKIPLPPG